MERDWQSIDYQDIPQAELSPSEAISEEDGYSETILQHPDDSILVTSSSTNAIGCSWNRRECVVDGFEVGTINHVAAVFRNSQPCNYGSRGLHRHLECELYWCCIDWDSRMQERYPLLSSLV